MQYIWVWASIGALLNFGLWGFFAKLADIQIGGNNAFIYHVIGIIAVTIIFLLWKIPSGTLVFTTKGFLFAVSAGAAYAVGTLLFFIALNLGKAETVVTLTALYPAVTLVLAYFILNETITVKQVFGIILAFIAIYLLVD